MRLSAAHLVPVAAEQVGGAVQGCGPALDELPILLIRARHVSGGRPPRTDYRVPDRSPFNWAKTARNGILKYQRDRTEGDTIRCNPAGHVCDPTSAPAKKINSTIKCNPLILTKVELRF